MSENQINISTVPDQTPQPTWSPPPRSEAAQHPPRSIPDNHDSAIADLESLRVVQDHVDQQQNQQMQSVLVAFCYTTGLEIALQFSENQSKPSLSFNLVSVGLILTFSLLLLAKFIRSSSNKVSKVLEKASYVVAATTSYYIITFPLSAAFKCVIWSISAISLLILVIYNRCFHTLPSFLESSSHPNRPKTPNPTNPAGFCPSPTELPISKISASDPELEANVSRLGAHELIRSSHPL